MKKFYLLIILLISFFGVRAAHIVGGEVVYNFVSKTPTTITYDVTVILFRDNLCPGNCAALPPSVSIGIFDNGNSQQIGGYINVVRNSEIPLQITQSPACLTNAPNFNYSGGYYTTRITLDNNQAGYTVTYQTCCRVANITNLGPRFNDPTQGGPGVTYSTSIPGQNLSANLLDDNSARFETGISIICFNKRFTLDFSATDQDGDSLFYEFVDGLDAPPNATDASFATPVAPPYQSLFYQSPYSGLQPLGLNGVTINNATGLITGIAPAQAGKYVVAVEVSSFRNGVRINRHRKDFLVTVSPCDFSAAELNLSYSNCKDSTFSFVNNNNSPNNLTFFWDFGDGNTSTAEMPVHTYADTGAYTIKLVINAGTSCADSSTAPLIVFPTFRTGFSESSPACKNTPVFFRDSSFATYGPVNTWSWNFGDPTSGINNIANTQNTTHSYATAGQYNATLISTSVKGCRDTLRKLVTIVDKPVFNVGNDTLICVIDTLQLNTVGVTAATGTITWSPNTNIDNVNSFSPRVSPDVTTTYIATYTDNSGCFASDTIIIRVVNDVSVLAMADTTICRTDSLRLRVVSDGLSFSWTPVALLSNPAAQNPFAFPTAALTTFTVTASIGNCRRSDNVVVRTVPFPNARAGNDSTVCLGADVPLLATGGSSYSWSPTFFLTNANIRNPIAIAPPRTLDYIVTVTDTLGCPKPVRDTVRINVVRIVAAAGPRDTAIVLGQPLQLNATGGQFYSWTPSTFLNNPNINNPISNPTDSITYFLTVSDSIGCFGRDTITVRVFRLEPGLYVPTAFTPNGNSINDVFRPIALGIRSLDYFRVYNRWGELVFATSEIGKGWDGNYKGKEQGTSAFVWQALATDYTGQRIFKKGSVVLVK